MSEIEQLNMPKQQKIVVQYRKDEPFYQIEQISQVTSPCPNRELMSLMGDSINARKNPKVKKQKNLKEILGKIKVERLTSNFIKKLRWNSNLEDHEMEMKSNSNVYMIRLEEELRIFGLNDGIVLPKWCLIFWSMLHIIQTAMMLFACSIMTAFEETENYPLFFYVQICSCFIYLLDIGVNFVLQRYEGGKKLSKIQEISAYYLWNGFPIDVMSLLILFISLGLRNTPVESIVLTIIYFLKLFSSIRKLEKFEYLIITNNEKEQYYGLIKVLLTNFLIGHILSIFLNLMPNMDSQVNWQIKMGISESEWYIKYIWGYYWGTNIMLSVGFGDIVATNYYEAIVLVFIETFSCITLAYNISHVGAMLGAIRENEESRKRKLKVFHRMCKENEVCNQIESKISNFIQESYEIKQAFEYDVRDEVIQFLPKTMQRQYRKEANKILFDGLGFLNNLSKKSLLTLAEEVNRRICHPEEIIVKSGSITDFCVLQKGKVAFTCRTKSNLDGKIIENFEVEGESKPKILSLDFIKNKIIPYNIKSLNYSVLYYMGRESFIDSLRGSEMDFELFCLMKDKDDYIIGENNLYPCSNCKGEYHDKFGCSRLHFIPIKQHVIMKFITKSNQNSQQREYLFRNKNIISHPLIYAKQLCQEQEKYVEDNYDMDHLKEIEELVEFYANKTNQEQDHIRVNDRGGTIGNTFLGFNSERLGIYGGNVNGRSFLEDKTISKLEKLLEANKSENSFWDLEVDAANDFVYYWKESNPDNLHRLKKHKKWKANNKTFDTKKSLVQLSFFS